TGRINPIDSARAVAYHQQILSDLSENLLAGIVPQASNSRSSEWSPAQVSDGNYDSYWATADGVTSASLTFALNKPTLLNRLLIQEYIPL
ncbi:MAG: discoidin domain-containing protein, partial [Mucinivorans sp.]